MAKIFKVPVREFSVGMGPRIVSKVIKNTRYSLKVLPIGGSCALIGEDVAGSGDMMAYDGVKIDDNGLYDFEGVKFTKEEVDKNNYQAISPVKKFFICVAGPFMNFLVAFSLAFILVSYVGYDLPIISSVSEGSAAMEARPSALMAGDKIIELEIPGQKEKIICYRDLALFMQLNNDDIITKNYPLIVTYERDDRINRTVLHPTYNEEYKKAIIGVTFDNAQRIPSAFVDKLKFASSEFYFYIKTTIMSLKLLIRGKLSAKDVSGPVGTVAVMGSAISEASSVGIGYAALTLISLIVLISANLGVMNLLPIPALDGGRIIFAAVEMITGKPINKELEAFVNSFTMVLLLIFMMWIFGQDLYKILSGNLF